MIDKYSNVNQKKIYIVSPSKKLKQIENTAEGEILICEFIIFVLVKQYN